MSSITEVKMNEDVVIGLYTITGLQPGDMIGIVAGYTTSSAGCAFRIKDEDGDILIARHNWHKNKDCIINRDAFVSQKHVTYETHGSLSEIVSYYMETKWKYVVKGDDYDKDLTWWNIGVSEDEVVMKEYKKRTTKADFVRMAQLVRMLKPVMLPHMPGFKPYDRGKLEQWQLLVHRSAAQLYDTSDVRADGTKLFSMPEVLSMAGASDTPVFDVTKTMVAGDSIA
jgi:hypothetical protein